METKELSEIIALVPAYCPEQSMVESVTALTEIFPAVIIVDDGCGAEYKGIFDAVEGLKGVTILRHPENRGKGCALKTGLTIYWRNIRRQRAWSHWMRTASIR